MKTSRLIFTIGLFYALTSSLSAQQVYSPGYIVIAGQDSSAGWIAELPASKRKFICLFKATHESVVDSFPAISLDGYGFESGPAYESLLIRQKGKDSVTYYMERIVEGEANLYWYRDNIDSHFYLKSDKISGRLMRGGEETIVTPQRVITRKILDYKQLLIQLSSENEEIAEEPKGVGLNRKDLTKFVYQWNMRTEEGARQSSMVKVKQPLSYALGPVTQVGPNNYSSSPINKGVRVGAVLNISKPYAFNNIMLQLMPMVSSLEFGEEQDLGIYYHKPDSSAYIQSTSLPNSLDEVNVHISVGKYWQFRRISPYFLLGTNVILFYEYTTRIRNDEIQRATGTILNSTRIPKTYTSIAPNSFLQNIYITPGATFHLSPRIDVSAQAMLDMLYPIFGPDDGGLQFLRFTVMVPIRLGEL